MEEVQRNIGAFKPGFGFNKPNGKKQPIPVSPKIKKAIEDQRKKEQEQFNQFLVTRK